MCGIIAGAVPSATSAADVQDNYLDAFRCDDDNRYRYDNDDVRSAFEDRCDELTILRNSQVANCVHVFILYIYIYIFHHQ